MILSQTFEYRPPTNQALKKAVSEEGSPPSIPALKVDMTSRFLGLIVVPGKHIEKIESEGG